MKINNYPISTWLADRAGQFKLDHAEFKEKQRIKDLEIRKMNENLVVRGIERVPVSEIYHKQDFQVHTSARMRVPAEAVDDMMKCLDEYYAGRLSDRELVDAYMDICIKVGTCDSERVLDVYENFIHISNSVANAACSRKGEEISRLNGNGDGRGAVYYDADFYYAFEHVKELARDASSQIAETMGWKEMDFDKVEAETIYTLDGGLDFNSRWAYLAQNRLNHCVMIDTRLAPPEGFAFCIEETNRNEDGSRTLLLRTKAGYKEYRILFSDFRKGRGSENFMLAEVCRFEKNERDNYWECNAFLMNFYLFRNRAAF